MILSASYTELESLIRQKTGKAISLAYAGPRKLSVGYTMSVNIPIIGKAERHFDLDVVLKNLSGTKCTLDFEAQGIAGFALDHLKGFILGKLPDGLVESFSGREAVVNLASIPKIKKLLLSVDIHAVEIDPSGLKLDLYMR